MEPRLLGMHDILRYAQGGDRTDVEVGGYLSFHFVTSAPGRQLARIQLERGINQTAVVTGPDGPRRPLIAIRSSPWKVGHASNPWHEEFDLDCWFPR